MRIGNGHSKAEQESTAPVKRKEKKVHECGQYYAISVFSKLPWIP